MRTPAPFALAAALALSAALPAGLTGCKSFSDLAQSADKPTLRVVGAGIDSLDLQSAGLTFDVEVTNPYSVPLPLTNVKYALAAGATSAGGGGAAAQTPFLSGNAAMQGNIPASGKKTIKVPTRVVFADVLSAAKGVKPGAVVPYAADLDFSVDAPVVGKLNLPVRKQGDLPVPAAPEVRVADAKWETRGLTGASGLLTLNVKNTNAFPLDLRTLGYALEVGGKRVAGGDVSKALALAPGAAGNIEIPLDVSLTNLGMGAFAMLTGSKDTYKVTGSVAAGTPFGPANLGYTSAK
jgi:LEA14-like dessication related protein